MTTPFAATDPRHYFRIQGANHLVEFDNSGGNHIHSVWRDIKGDFGRDAPREHYRRAEGRTSARHGLNGWSPPSSVALKA